MKTKWRVRVLRELTTQWAVYAFENDGQGTQLEEPIGAVGLDGARFVPFVALWPASNDKAVLNEVKVVTDCTTLSAAVAAVVAAKQQAEQFIGEALARQANGVHSR